MIYVILLLIAVILGFVIAVMVVIEKCKELQYELFNIKTKFNDFYIRLYTEEAASRDLESRMNNLESVIPKWNL